MTRRKKIRGQPAFPAQSKFFSDDNLHRFLWAMLGAIILALAKFSYGTFHGKDKIIVATPNDGAEPLVVHVQNPPPSSNLEPYFRDLVQELKRFRANAEIGRALNSGVEPEDAAFNFIQIPHYALPKSVQGYTHHSLSGIADIACPPIEIRSNEAITMEMRFLAGKRISEFTPVFVRILREGTEANSVILEYFQQYELRRGLNRFRIQTELPVGTHEARVGFYSISELKQEYPPLYSVNCQLKVQPPGSF